jgi:uncharacterized protein YycO
MEYVHAVYCNSHLPLSPVIRMVTNGRWSHVALMSDAGHVLEATGSHGVVETPLEDLIKRSSEYCIVRRLVPDGTHAKLVAVGRTQLGKKYDWWGIFGLSLNRDWQNDENWWCSEYFAWKFDQVGVPLVRASAVHRVTPEDMWKLPWEVVYASHGGIET